MATSTIVLLVIVYVLSVSVNLLLFDKNGSFEKPLEVKEDKIMVTLLFVPFFNTFLALLGSDFIVVKIIRKIRFDK